MYKFALFGHPVAHSLSPIIQQAFARQVGLAISYELIDPGLNGFEFALRKFVAQGGQGANITAPFKQHAAKLVNYCTPNAQQSQAINTISIQPNGDWLGDNTDGVGFINDLKINYQFDFFRKTILLIGAGGAAYGILPALFNEKPNKIIVINRNFNKATALYKHFVELATQCAVQLLVQQENVEEECDLIINATSASLKGELPAMVDVALKSTTWCYDMVYAKTQTVFQQWASNHGAKYAYNGLGMLVEQAAAAFYLWCGVRPDTRQIMKSINTII